MKITTKYILGLCTAGLLGFGAVSCQDSKLDDLLDLGPIDNYGSGNFWKTQEHARAYVVGLHSFLRDQTAQHIITFGEKRGGAYSLLTTGIENNTLKDGDLVRQNFDNDRTGVTNFGNLFGRITNSNIFIANVDKVGLPEEEKNYYLAQAYGIRAFYYFDLFRIYGGVPIRTTIEVVEGERDANKLYAPRVSPKDVLAQIDSDIQKSLELFGNRNEFNAYGQVAKAYWSKAATEALAAEVDLWQSKVTTYNAMADPSRLTSAKMHLNSLLTNYGLSLVPSFDRLFAADNKRNSEIILASYTAEGEASWEYVKNYLYDTNAGNLSKSSNHFIKDANGEYALFNNPFSVSGSGILQNFMYDNRLYLSYDEEDQRRLATFLPIYEGVKDGSGNVVDHKFVGTVLAKNLGHMNAQNIRVYDGEVPYYRLAWVYLSLAEIANYEGNNSEVERNINEVRKRAYGENWDSDRFGYKAGSFKDNELAILQEKDKEFVNEGQRWWDMRRMQESKGGRHFVFVKEANFYQDYALLNESTEAHKVLWPVDKALLNNEILIVQTPGYTNSTRDYDGSWE